MSGQTMFRAATIVLACLFTNIFSAPVNHLDVSISRKELKRFFHEFDIGDFYIIRKGVIDNFVQNHATGYLPAIVPSIHTLELRFQSKYKLYYKLYLSSSDKTLMRTPTASIKLSGQVPRKSKPFRIRFPCNGRKSGEGILTVKMEFMVPSRKKSVITKFALKLKRKCEKDYSNGRFRERIIYQKTLVLSDGVKYKTDNTVGKKMLTFLAKAFHQSEYIQ